MKKRDLFLLKLLRFLVWVASKEKDESECDEWAVSCIIWLGPCLTIKGKGEAIDYLKSCIELDKAIEFEALYGPS